MNVFVTGAAGFIGMHVCERLLADGHTVTGLDDFNAYYDPRLKDWRAARLARHAGFRMVRGDIADDGMVRRLVGATAPDIVIHLAAQAGVRHSIDHPFAYERSNVRGHLSLLEAVRHTPSVQHLVYASSSSVYGDRPMNGVAFREDDTVRTPNSLYAATKVACELMSTSYSSLYGLAQTGLRFFTVYGDAGRPDMAYFKFLDQAFRKETIDVYGHGDMARDFTHIDDIVESIARLLAAPPERGENRVLNIGSAKPVRLLDMIALLEARAGFEFQKKMLPMQPGDVRTTFADVSRLEAITGFRPGISLTEGLDRFVTWFEQEYLPLSTQPV